MNVRRQLVKDKDGNITSVKIIAKPDLAYYVVLDEKGKELGKTMAGKMVKVHGTVETKDNAKWLTVKEFKETKEKEEPKKK